MKRAETIILFKDLHKTLAAISNEDAGALMKALFAHANGLDPDSLDNYPIAAALYIGLADQIDRIEEYRAGQATKRNKIEQTGTNDNKQEQSASPSPSPYPCPDPYPMTGQSARPTPAEVKDWAAAEGLLIDAERFVAYYDDRDWKTGTDPIKDWKKVARKWAQTEHRKQPEKPPDRKPGKYTLWMESQDYGDLISGRASR